MKRRDAEFVGVKPESVGWWSRREAPLGMTPEQYGDFKAGLFEALEADGISAEDVDVRLQGSSAHFFSGAHKRLANERDPEVQANPEAQEGLEDWFHGDTDRPLRRPFDSHHTLTIDEEPSDYDLQLSSDAMVEKCRDTWQEFFPSKDFKHGTYGFVHKRSFETTYPRLIQWAEQQSELLDREVAPALFGSHGPPDQSPGVSAHFRDSDWKLEKDSHG